MANDAWSVSTYEGLNLSGAIADIDAQIASLQEKKRQIKALKKEAKRLAVEHKKASWGKGLYASKNDNGNGNNDAYSKLKEETNTFRWKKLERLGFKVDACTAWDCVKIK